MSPEIAKTHRLGRGWTGSYYPSVLVGSSVTLALGQFSSQELLCEELDGLLDVFPLHSGGEESNQIVHKFLCDSLPLLLQGKRKPTDGDRGWRGSYCPSILMGSSITQALGLFPGQELL
ncbi:hypothetical protein AVEN_78674-1 [Araneus ventricosus]|uniref:Uncharacterized protein n=1 Tax=Araneus ventricosus TaxID=182803 RepID=A0A4Y2W586_ARAVE|nr:hypothetical protein AVEN_78674-1 [Araneus ventricosus]